MKPSSANTISLIMWSILKVGKSNKYEDFILVTSCSTH